MSLPVDSVIQHTLTTMQRRIEQKTQSGVSGNEQSGLLYLGNIHDSIPRQLFLDNRLAPLDKMAWVMIRLYAQQNEGAIFPTYDELQIQLASPHSAQASRETISRVLLMLRLTGWLSLCKRVRDNDGCVRGNIYAQHDESLNFKDCEIFDPDWLNLVARSCQHSNKTIRLTALTILEDLKTDSTMRHRHSRVAQIEQRLSTIQSPKQMVDLIQAQNRTQAKPLSSDAELSTNSQCNSLNSNTELSTQTKDSARVRKSNPYYVRYSNNVKNTYVSSEQCYWPDILAANISQLDQQMLQQQLAALPNGLGQSVLNDAALRLERGELRIPVAYVLANLKRARAGQFNDLKQPELTKTAPSQQSNTQPVSKIVSRASADSITATLASIRSQLSD